MRLPYLIILFCLFAFPSYAEENAEKPIEVPKGQFEDLKHTKTNRVDKVIDGLTVLLKDKTIIRLASLDIPDFHIWRNAPHSEAALKLLEEKLPEGTEVMIYQTRMAKKGRLNRMNHQLGHIVTKKDELWIQGLLLSHGLARVYVAPDATEMIGQMYETEQKARDNNLGIWSEESDFPLLNPDNISQAMGEMAVVEGTVEKAATVRNNIYLNFGKDWKTDFTIMMTPTLRKDLARKGINLMNLSGKKIRVRGFVREYNGPLIELDVAEHLEYPLPSADEKPILKPNP